MSDEHEPDPERKLEPELPQAKPQPGQLEQIEKKRIARNFWKGFTIAVGANAVVVTSFFQSFNWGIGTAWSVPFSIACAGLVLQLIFFISAGVCASMKVKTGLSMGLIAGSALTVLLLPATCFGMAFVLQRS